MEANLNGLCEHYPKGSYQVSIFQETAGDFQGKIYYPGSVITQIFSSAWQMVKEIEADILQNSFSQNTFELCSKNAATKKNGQQEQPKDKHKFDKVLCTFFIQIQYCQNATWQGIIYWLEKRQTKTFRSQFEMLRLIEEAIMM